MAKLNLGPLILQEKAEITSPRFSCGLRIAFMETSGALGDLGTLIPLLAKMVSLCGLQLGPAH
jgi:hypothetical protein